MLRVSVLESFHQDSIRLDWIYGSINNSPYLSKAVKVVRSEPFLEVFDPF